MKEIETKKRFRIYGSDDIEEAKALFDSECYFFDRENFDDDNAHRDTLSEITICSSGVYFVDSDDNNYSFIAVRIDN